MSFGFSYSSRILVALISIACVVPGCSPDVVSRNFKQANRDFGPTRDDGDLDLAEVKMAALPTATSIRWKGDIETAAWYRAGEDIAWLGQHLSSEPLSRLAVTMHEKVANGSLTWGTTVGRSAYASAAVGETKADAADAVKDGVDMLKQQERLIGEIVEERNRKTDWPRARITLVQVVVHVENFLVAFVRDVEQSSVNKAVKATLVEELRITFGPKIKRLHDKFAAAYAEPKVHDFVARVRRALKEESLDLGPNIDSQLDLAEKLPREVDRINDAKSALSVLVDFWRASSQETRDQKFKVLAPDLYDFFNGQSESDLECVRTGCGLFTRIKRALFILPAIESYGIEKLKRQLAEAAEEAIKSELEEQTVQFLPKFHEDVKKQILAEVGRQRENISKISTNYGTYLRLVLDRVALAKLGVDEREAIAGAEPNRIRVDLDFGRTGREARSEKVTATRVPRDARLGFQTGASSLGSGLSLAIEIHDSHLDTVSTNRRVGAVKAKQDHSRLYFEQLNKILMVGGFQTESNRPFEAFSIALGQPTVRRRNSPPARFNLRELMASKTTYAMPDQLIISRAPRADAVVASTVPKGVSVSVAGQADLLRGLSRAAYSLRDWVPSAFDRNLGPINVADFVPDLPRAAVSKKLFPKDLFYAAAIGNAGAILQNITKDLSSVALIEPTRAIHWANEEDKASTATERAIMATPFDIRDGVRVLESRTVDTARLLSAITVFLRATEGIDQTKSDLLTTQNRHGVRPTEQLAAARSDLKLLVMALANFLSSEALGSDGLVRPVFRRTKDGVAEGMSGTPALHDQATVIKALLDASDAIKAAIFRTSALDLMSATNEAFFNSEQGFYAETAGGTDVPNLETVAAMLVAGERLSSAMTPARAAQWTRASRPWINALRDAAETLP